jgi:adenylate kinase
VKDLVRFSLKISEMMPESKPYHFAFDNTEDRTLKSIIEDLSTSIGSGGIESISGETDLIPTDYQDMFKANLWANTSSFLKPPEQIDGEDAAPADFEWHAEKGIHGCSDKILSEFVNMHSLKPIKIVLSGHKDSGKTHFSSLLGGHYKIPVLSLKKIFEEFPPPAINPLPIDANNPSQGDDFELAEDYKDLKEEVDQVLNKVLQGQIKVIISPI